MKTTESVGNRRETWQRLLSHFSPVRLCATPQKAAPQAPPSLGFSRQERWSGVPLPSPRNTAAIHKNSCFPPDGTHEGSVTRRQKNQGERWVGTAGHVKGAEERGLSWGETERSFYSSLSLQHAGLRCSVQGRE